MSEEVWKDLNGRFEWEGAVSMPDSYSLKLVVSQGNSLARATALRMTRKGKNAEFGCIKTAKGGDTCTVAEPVYI